MAAEAGQKRRRRRKADEWIELLSRFSAGGQSIEAFCQLEGVSVASFYRWRGLLGNDSGQGGVPAAKPAFVDLGPLRPTPAANSGQPLTERLELHLDLGGGLMLHLVRG